MRILVHDFAGHPFEADLSRGLARSGHEITHAYCGGVTTGKGDLVRRSTDPSRLRFVDLWPGFFERYAPIERLRCESRYGAAAAQLVRKIEPDVVVSANAPLLAQASIWRAARRKGVLRLYWLQDFLGQGTRRVLTSRSRLLGGTAGRAFEHLETRLLRKSDGVIAIAEDFRDALDGRGVTVPRIVIENWAPLDEVDIRPQDNAWSTSEGLAGRPTAIYAGTLGLKHDPEHLVSVARALTGEACLVVITEGQGRDYLANRKEELVLDRLLLRDFVDYDTLPDVLGAATVCLVLLEEEAGTFSVPSKVLSYLAAGRAIVGAVPSVNLAARTIQRASAGVVVDPGDHAGFGRAVAELLDNPRKSFALGRAGREYAEESFDIEQITAQVLDFVAECQERR